MRRDIYRKCVSTVMNTPIESLYGNILHLVAPTGAGKTLTGLSCALKLRSIIYRKYGYLPRIIYSLPLINVIEQNYEVFKKVLSSLPDFCGGCESQYLIAHHHLSRISYRCGEEVPLDEALLLIESWESEIVVTTFVQLLHTIIGYKNSFLKKFHNLVGAILILDEVQGIPVEQWELLRRVLRGLMRYLGCTVIFMTATSPLIFGEKEGIFLVPDYKEYFSSLNRVVVHSRVDREMCKEDLVDIVMECWRGRRSLAVVLNTISDSIDIYTMLKRRLWESGDECWAMREFSGEKVADAKAVIVYLSTNITPLQRRERVEAVKGILESDRGQKVLVVSTQVIEAGVDLDFDVVIRDIGPVDSIVQVCGRCNRSGLRRSGEVYVVRLAHTKASCVYGGAHILVSRRLLESEMLQEADFLRIVRGYFEGVEKRISNVEATGIFDAMCELHFGSASWQGVSGYKLIVGGRDVSIFVAFSEEDLDILDFFRSKVLRGQDFQERRRNYLEIRRDFKDRVITVLYRRAIQNLPPRIDDLSDYRWIQAYDETNPFYDMETGFKWRGEDVWIV